MLHSRVVLNCNWRHVWALGCKYRVHSVSWPEVVKGVPNQGVDCSVSLGSYFLFCFVFRVRARVRVIGHLYSVILWDEPVAWDAQIWPTIARGSHGFTCHLLTNHICLQSPAAGHHRPLAGTHCAYRQMDGQARVYVVFCFLVFGCQYQCNRLPGKTRLWNDLLCVEWDVKPYTLDSLTKV